MSECNWLLKMIRTSLGEKCMWSCRVNVVFQTSYVAVVSRKRREDLKPWTLNVFYVGFQEHCCINPRIRTKISGEFAFSWFHTTALFTMKGPASAESNSGTTEPARFSSGWLFGMARNRRRASWKLCLLLWYQSVAELRGGCPFQLLWGTASLLTVCISQMYIKVLMPARNKVL